MSDLERGSERPTERVRVDQVGYLPSAPKRAVVAVESDGSTVEAERFAVRDAGDGTVALAGALSNPIDSPDAGETVRRADFSTLSEPGEYRVAVGRGETADGDLRETADESVPVRVGTGVYDGVLADAVRLYTLKRSNTAIDDPVTGLDVPPGHTQDAEARMYFGDAFREEGQELDVAGGWYDAGDYGKYVPPAAVTVGQMLLAYERYPAAFEAGQCDLPVERLGVERSAADGERESELPDLLVEAAFELEWLERMQREDGAVYHKVAASEWPAVDEAPTDDDRERYVYGLSTFGTAQYAAAMAMAARVYADDAPAFAERALDNARAAHDYLEDNPDPEFRFDAGQDDGSGPYRKDTDREERFWAAAELLKTTGDTRYADYLEVRFVDRFDAPPRAPVWTDALSLGQWAYLSADAADDARAERLASAFLDYADDLVADIEADGYGCALDTEDYHWASTKLALSKGGMLLLANAIDSDDRYVTGALDQLHYALGRTPTGYSYVTGQGTHPPRNPHDRLVEGTGTSIPGMVVGGANRNGDDETLAAYIAETDAPPAKCYVDATASYSVNEWAIDYTAPVFLLLGHATTMGE
ncbi:LPXTG-motif cell wall anchor domain-containing protein [Halosimplex carlsbadense 2-9-1]|uniref:LPXTG-motif cell wall anchor domain-containing protein n=1 Tax=Halosimplex carlsbadense 2-9-1 TaxID=797114 RepID=M0CLP5_9EURY|nr:glycoside hydrolase family 9 protein [Halosimplex carlsbadense]ELZ24171.1 LPXTG-motif cell wall anchor domain-containing protein [Halosimplex carlsbadense 2-9-1]